MAGAAPTSKELTDAIRVVAKSLGHPPSRSEFRSHSGITERQILNHFESWNDAVQAAGFQPYTTNIKLDEKVLFEDWATVVRKRRQIPTREQYRHDGSYDPGVFAKRFGPWSDLPKRFRQFAEGKPEWNDVLTLLPEVQEAGPVPTGTQLEDESDSNPLKSEMLQTKHNKLEGEPVYGNPVDFRGLRHEPINEQGVVFLFGMIAKELGYLVEAVQTGFPDCEAKRQVGVSNWQRVRIEFEFESRNFRDHGHAQNGCDVIVCWRHNWPDCPANLEVVELASVIKNLAKSDDF